MNWGVRTKFYYAERLSRTPAFQQFLSSNILEVTREEYQSLARQCIEYLQYEINEVAPSSYNSYCAWLSAWNRCFDHAAKTAGIVIKERDMTGTVENSINVLVKELKDNRKVDKDEALDYISYVFRLITQNNVPLDQRQGVAMTVNDCTKRIRGGNFHRPEGFFGNWAKQLEEKGEVTEYDDHYSGC